MSDEQLLFTVLNLGEALLTSGAEVNRTEDTISRICRAYGFAKCDVFTITSSIVVTVRAEDGAIHTQTRRIKQYLTDLERVSDINMLSRKICGKQGLPREDFERELEAILKKPHNSQWMMILLYGGIAAAFAVFFGGTVRDAACAFLAGMLIRAVQWLGMKIEMNQLVLTILCSIAGAAGAWGMVKCGMGQNVDKIVIGTIMLLIPGLSFTSSLRDMISGDTISGLLGFCEAILKAAAIAVGFALVLIPLGGLS